MQYFSVSLTAAVYRRKCAVQCSARVSKGRINPFYWTSHWNLTTVVPRASLEKLLWAQSPADLIWHNPRGTTWHLMLENHRFWSDYNNLVAAAIVTAPFAVVLQAVWQQNFLSVRWRKALAVSLYQPLSIQFSEGPWRPLLFQGLLNQFLISLMVIYFSRMLRITNS